MTYRVAYQKATDWKRKIQIVKLYHTIRKLKKPDWGVRDTAKYFQIGLGTAAENLKIAQNWPKLRISKSRNEAIKRMRGIKL